MTTHRSCRVSAVRLLPLGLACAAGLLLALPGCGGRRASGAGPGNVTAPIGGASEMASPAGATDAGRVPTGATVVTGNAGGYRKFDVSANDWRDAGYRQDWVGYPFVATMQGNAVRDLVVGSDWLIAQNTAGTVSVLSASTGQLKWSTEYATPLTRFVGLTRDPVDRDRLLVSSESEVFIVALDNGSLLGREKLARVVNTAPVAEQGMLIYGSAVGEIIAHRLGLGLKAWGFQGVGGIDANPVVVDRNVVMVSQAGDVTFIEPRSGSLQGRARIFAGVESNPVASDDAVYLASLDQSVYAFDSNGRQLWRYRTPAQLRNQLALLDNVLYLDIPEQGLTAINTTTGEPIWNNLDVRGTVVGARGSRLLVFTKERMTVVDPTKGAIVKAFDAPGIVKIIATQPKDGVLYAITADNLVVKLTPR